MGCNCGPQALATKVVKFVIVAPDGREIVDGNGEPIYDDSVYEARARASALGPGFQAQQRIVPITRTPPVDV